MWKKDRLAGGRLEGCKERGEWAELYFMMQAAGRGLKVSRPFSLAGRYDVGVENPVDEGRARDGQAGNGLAGDEFAIPRRQATVLRVQVKSTIYKRRNDEYSLNVMGPKRKKYVPGTVDFFAILVIPIDAWYIIPFDVLGRTNSSIHFTPAAVRQKYGRYLEAWDLLKQRGITIEACADEDWEEGAELEEMEEEVVIEVLSADVDHGA
jgi:hypothetical protein